MTGSTVHEVLQRYAVGLTESDVAADLDRALGGVPGAGSAPLSDGELAYLTEHAGGDAARLAATWDPQVEREQRAAAAVAAVEQVVGSSLGIEQVATYLGVDRSRISHRLAAGTLYAVTVGSRRRIPTWQFHQHAELPGLAQVVAAIPPGAHPLDIAAVMTTPQDELVGRTPVEHLVSGGDPSPVVDLLVALNRW